MFVRTRKKTKAFERNPQTAEARRWHQQDRPQTWYRCQRCAAGRQWGSKMKNQIVAAFIVGRAN
ncbi:MAG: hypothetical protein WA704_13710, partial [Pseudolabrys sp.]